MTKLPNAGIESILAGSCMFGRKTGKTTSKRAAAWPMALALSLLATAQALAAPPECALLKRQLAQLSGSVVQLDEYGNAADTQRDQIDLARIRAADLGCDRAVSGETVAACAELNARISAMQDNLGRLEQNGATAPSKTDRRERIRILDALELAGCNAQTPEEAAAASGEEDPLDEPSDVTIIRGGAAESLSSNESYPQHIVIGRSNEPGTGEYRTLCVRTCDGYSFPMSNGADLQDFQRDQQNCEASCPGTEIELFYHLRDGQPQESMVSARSGQPYRNLPTAYRYKRVDLPRVPSCGCNISQNKDFSILAGEGRAVTAKPKPAAVAEPAPPAASPSQPPDPNRKVRAVGPEFLPDPQGAIDLRAPGQTPAR
jgi:hypothetical protein